MATRRKWSKRRTKAEAVAIRSRAMLLLSAAGFSASELTAVTGLSLPRVGAIRQQLALLRGGAIGPDDEFIGAVDSLLDRLSRNARPVEQ